MMNTYFNWFKKLINVLIELFFVLAIIVTVYVFTSSLTGVTRIVLFVIGLIVYGLLVFFLKDKVKSLLKTILKKLEIVSSLKMVIIISVLMILFKVLFTVYFNFDATQNGDIQIYNQIANQIVTTGNLHSDAISHLFGVALHFVVFKLINLPIHVGMFIAIYIGVIVNFLSFKDIIGKEKSFLAVILYVLMPSTSLLSLCPTHEVLLFMYLSLFFFIFNKFIKTESIRNEIIYAVLMVIDVILACFVNPSGNILLVIMVLIIVLSKVITKKKAFVIIVLVLSLLGSNGLNKALEVNEHITTMNTYTILIHGSNIDSLGEQVDWYPLRQIRNYIANNTLDYSDQGFEDGAKVVLLNQYKDLITNPIKLIELIAHKFYILWSGNHYSCELAHNYGAYNDLTFYIFLSLSALIYLFTLTIGFVFNKKKDDDIYPSNYKLTILGCIAITMLCVVVNKYSLYVTLFIYFVSFYRIYIDGKH